MKIDILFFAGCPHHGKTVELVREVVRELGVEGEIHEVEVTDDVIARARRFLGSPTVQVDGVDIDPASEGRWHGAMSCRMYGGSGVPPREMIVAALVRQGAEGA